MVICRLLSIRAFSTTMCHQTKPWIQRHITDPYVRRSVKENYRARSAFKLIEMNEKYKFIEAGQIVMDMGAAPGAWSQVLVKQVNASVKSKPKRSSAESELIHPSEITALHQMNLDKKCGVVIALDRLPIFDIPGAHIIDDWNLTDETNEDCHRRLQDLLNRLKIDKVDGILSDMCPNVTGCRSIDHLAIANLQEKALNFARQLLKPNGYFLCKLFQGQDGFQNMRSLLQTLFHVVHHIKPSASREESPEMYLLAMKYNGTGVILPKKLDEKSNPRVETDRAEIERLLAEARRVRTKKKEKQ